LTNKVFAQGYRTISLLVAHPALPACTFQDEVETRQVAPTILKALGIDTDEAAEPVPGAYPTAARLRGLRPFSGQNGL